MENEKNQVLSDYNVCDEPVKIKLENDGTRGSSSTESNQVQSDYIVSGESTKVKLDVDAMEGSSATDSLFPTQCQQTQRKDNNLDLRETVKGMADLDFIELMFAHVEKLTSQPLPTEKDFIKHHQIAFCQVECRKRQLGLEQALASPKKTNLEFNLFKALDIVHNLYMLNVFFKNQVAFARTLNQNKDIDSMKTDVATLRHISQEYNRELGSRFKCKENLCNTYNILADELTEELKRLEVKDCPDCLIIQNEQWEWEKRNDLACFVLNSKTLMAMPKSDFIQIMLAYAKEIANKPCPNGDETAKYYRIQFLESVLKQRVLEHEGRVRTSNSEAFEKDREINKEIKMLHMFFQRLFVIVDGFRRNIEHRLHKKVPLSEEDINFLKGALNKLRSSVAIFNEEEGLRNCDFISVINARCEEQIEKIQTRFEENGVDESEFRSQKKDKRQKTFRDRNCIQCSGPAFEEKVKAWEARQEQLGAVTWQPLQLREMMASEFITTMLNHVGNIAKNPHPDIDKYMQVHQIKLCLAMTDRLREMLLASGRTSYDTDRLQMLRTFFGRQSNRGFLNRAEHIMHSEDRSLTQHDMDELQRAQIMLQRNLRTYEKELSPEFEFKEELCSRIADKLKHMQEKLQQICMSISSNRKRKSCDVLNNEGGIEETGAVSKNEGHKRRKTHDEFEMCSKCSGSALEAQVKEWELKQNQAEKADLQDCLLRHTPSHKRIATMLTHATNIVRNPCPDIQSFYERHEIAKCLEVVIKWKREFQKQNWSSSTPQDNEDLEMVQMLSAFFNRQNMEMQIKSEHILHRDDTSVSKDDAQELRRALTSLEKTLGIYRKVFNSRIEFKDELCSQIEKKIQEIQEKLRQYGVSMISQNQKDESYDGQQGSRSEKAEPMEQGGENESGTSQNSIEMCSECSASALEAKIKEWKEIQNKLGVVEVAFDRLASNDEFIKAMLKHIEHIVKNPYPDRQSYLHIHRVHQCNSYVKKRKEVLFGINISERTQQQNEQTEILQMMYVFFNRQIRYPFSKLSEHQIHSINEPLSRNGVKKLRRLLAYLRETLASYKEELNKDFICKDELCRQAENKIKKIEERLELNGVVVPSQNPNRK